MTNLPVRNEGLGLLRSPRLRYDAHAHVKTASWRSGYAEDCKSLYGGSIPSEASKKQQLRDDSSPKKSSLGNRWRVGADKEENMANVYVEPRPKGRAEGAHIEDYVVEDHTDHVLATFKTQHEAIEWARTNGHHPLVARVRHMNDKREPGHWRAA
jgi:hypothetical protein